LWWTAIAALALLLQTLLIGLTDDPASAAGMDHGRMIHSSSDGSSDQHRTLPACSLCCVCSTGMASIDAPSAPPAMAPTRDAWLFLARLRASAARCPPAGRGAHRARGPPRRA
jgi:hypothetical protein